MMAAVRHLPVVGALHATHLACGLLLVPATNKLLPLFLSWEQTIWGDRVAAYGWQATVRPPCIARWASFAWQQPI